MNHRKGKANRAALMELHVRAMFTHDGNMQIRTINEPWPGEELAPRFSWSNDRRLFDLQVSS